MWRICTEFKRIYYMKSMEVLVLISEYWDFSWYGSITLRAEGVLESINMKNKKAMHIAVFK